jgi:hypothetical protein
MNRKTASLIGVGMTCLGGLLFLLTRSLPAYHAISLLLIIAGPMVAARLRGGSAWNRAASANALAFERQWQNLKQTWPVGAAIAGLVVASSYLLYHSAVTGGEGALPVVFFTVSGFVAMGYFTYLLNSPTK